MAVTAVCNARPMQRMLRQSDVESIPPVSKFDVAAAAVTTRLASRFLGKVTYVRNGLLRTIVASREAPTPTIASFTPQNSLIRSR